MGIKIATLIGHPTCSILRPLVYTRETNVLIGLEYFHLIKRRNSNDNF